MRLGNCQVKTANACDWDYSGELPPRKNFRDRRDRSPEVLAREQSRGRALCGNCPLLETCAMAALLDAPQQGSASHWLGVIVAGIPFSYTTVHRSQRLAGLVALALISQGVPLPTAQSFQATLATTKQPPELRRLVSWLQRRLASGKSIIVGNPLATHDSPAMDAQGVA